MLFEGRVVNEAVLGQLAETLGVQWQVQDVANSGGKAHQVFGQMPQARFASACLGHQLDKPVGRKHLIVGNGIDSVFAALAQGLDSRADIADRGERTLVLERREWPREASPRNAPEKIQVAFVPRAVDHRGAKDDGASIEELLGHKLRLSVGCICIRRLAAREVDKARHHARRGVENALGETYIDVEVALRIADVLEVVRLSCQVDDGVNLGEVDAIKLVPCVTRSVWYIVALCLGDIKGHALVAFVDQIAAEISAYEPVGAGD